MIPAEIIVKNQEGVITRYRLAQMAMVGRHPECEIQLTDPMCSRRHCKIERTQAGLFIAEDNGSANGTLLNGEPLKTRCIYKTGDVLRIGNTELVLRLESAKPSYDPAVSVVRLEDEGEESSSPNVDFAQKADLQVVSDEEASSSDVTKLKRVTERLKLLVDVGKAMGTTLDAGRLLTICLDKLFEVFPQSDRGIIVLYGADGSLPKTLSPEKEGDTSLDRRKGAMTKVKFRPNAERDNEIRLSRTVVNRVRTERQSVLVSDASGDAAGLSMAKFEIRSLMCAPLLIGNEDLGLIELETKNRAQAFNPEDLGVLTAVAGQVAVIIRNSDLAREAAAAAAQKENLSRFLSPNLVDQVLKGSVSLELGGTEKKGTIFFSDIVSFTKMAAKLTPQNVVTLLNRYFTVMQNIVFRRGGSIDKCQGDNIMAHWGVLGESSDGALSAVTAGIEMQNSLFAFNRDEALKNEIVLPPTPLGHGIGLNTGIVCAGNIGSDRKIEFTVIGDAVNLSARIEAMAARGQVLVGAPTYEEIKGRALCVKMPATPAKNVEKPVEIYCVRGIVPPAAEAAALAPDSAINAMLFSLPCVLNWNEGKANALVTSITRGSESGTRLSLQVESAVPVGIQAALEWRVPEKASLPKLEGAVEKCTPPRAGKEASDGKPPISAAPKSGTAVLLAPTVPGTLLLNVKQLPDQLAEWRPGMLLNSDLKSHEEMVRA